MDEMADPGVPAVDSSPADLSHGGDSGPVRRREDDVDTARSHAPVLVVRPHAWYAVVGCVLVVLGLAGVAVSSPLLVLVLPGIALLATRRLRIELDDRTIRRRGLLGWDDAWRLDEVIAMRLRRVPWSGNGTARRAIRIGRFASVPLRLRIYATDDPVVEITVAFWADWALLARAIAGREGLDVDTRSRKRLARYLL
jgi:hypothetical protein